MLTPRGGLKAVLPINEGVFALPGCKHVTAASVLVAIVPGNRVLCIVVVAQASYLDQARLEDSVAAFICSTRSK